MMSIKNNKYKNYFSFEKNNKDYDLERYYIQTIT